MVPNKVWEMRIDGKWSIWMMDLEFFVENNTAGNYFQPTRDFVMGPMMRAIEWPIFPYDWDNPDHEETMCPLVVRLEQERQEGEKTDAENQS